MDNKELVDIVARQEDIIFKLDQRISDLQKDVANMGAMYEDLKEEVKRIERNINA